MITEYQLEQLAIQWFQDTGWGYVNGAGRAPKVPSPERADFRDILLKARLAAAVRRWDPKLPPAAVEKVVDMMMATPETNLPRNNRAFNRLLKFEFTNANGEKDADHAQPVNLQNPARNDFLVVNQFTVARTMDPRWS